MSEENVSIRQQLIRHQMAIKAIGVVAATLIALMVGLWPLLKSSGTLLRKIETRSKEEESLSKKVAILSQIDQEVLKERTKVIKAALPETKDVIAYLRAVDGLSKELGLSFGGITVFPGDVSGVSQKSSTSRTKDTRKVALLNVLDTDIKITGTRDGIYAFLRQVEQTLPLMQVSNVVVTKLEDDLYSMTLSLGMLWAPTPTVDLKGPISLFTEKEENYFQKLNVFKTYNGTSITESPAQNDGRIDLFR
ncbi:MAG: hypothetical protein Fur0011_4320 [Candidatus Microgenomates bacterium]